MLGILKLSLLKEIIRWRGRQIEDEPKINRGSIFGCGDRHKKLRITTSVNKVGVFETNESIRIVPHFDPLVLLVYRVGAASAASDRTHRRAPGRCRPSPC